MSLWIKKDGKTAAVIPITDLLVPILAIFVGVITLKLLKLFGFEESLAIVITTVITVSLALIGLIAARIYFVKRMNSNGWE